ncbi:PLP-dependent aminotransferase family protein [Niabella pedocola]|uniref:PLP-dependent aminotransferase family protein n=1 Tax=Niabella pedocola TaxID=1752077 RepID=A0ABS8PU13_9BACT|nr:PLP-dependent aminotransferase family protein [Niabella pedocola]MCD2424558.1 PLP-dependent aminotransferase family protein [Niabella pedocola]
MSSPVQLPYKTILPIDRQSATAVYLQIVHHVINAIQRGFLSGGQQLPGTRAMSLLLEVHRKTVVAAYEELDAQGWITSRPNKGSFIKPVAHNRRTKKLDMQQLTEYPATTGFHFKRSNILDVPEELPGLPLRVTDGQPDYRLSPTDQLARYYTAALRRKVNRKHLGYNTLPGNVFFKTQLSNFLNSTRGLHITPRNILVTRGVEMGMYVSARTLINPGDTILVGNPGYYTANMTFQQSGARLKTIPVDQDGISVEAVERICKKQAVRMLYLTPHHHYPTTATLSAQRRVALLKLSATYGFIILEDDYEYDFHYQSSPILPLASADTEGMVVYLGSFGKTLAPGFRAGFLVAPASLIDEMEKVQAIIDRQGDTIMEQVLGELIAEGEIHRHLKKVQKIYHERRNHFCKMLSTELGDSVSFTTPPGGLAVWTQWKQGMNLLRMSKACAAQGLQLPRFLLYQTRELSAMRLGFGNFTLAEASNVLMQLKTAAASEIAL